jgi:hypothetical protein
MCYIALLYIETQSEQPKSKELFTPATGEITSKHVVLGEQLGAAPLLAALPL